MTIRALVAGVAVLLMSLTASGGEFDDLRKALTLHASFDKGLGADYSRGTKECTVKQGKDVLPARENENVRIAKGAGRFGNGLQFTRKSSYWPGYAGEQILDYNSKNWSTTVSVWLRLDPDRDLEPGYCDPIQIVGDDVKKGFIFMEWSKDHKPRHFRFAVWPRQELWNPGDVGWEELPNAKRPMVLVERAPFRGDAWTHAVFTLENVNDRSKPRRGRLFLNGKLQGAIDRFDLTLGWNPSDVRLVLGAAYVGYMDDLAVFNRALSETEVDTLFRLSEGVSTLLH